MTRVPYATRESRKDAAEQAEKKAREAAETAKNLSQQLNKPEDQEKQEQKANQAGDISKKAEELADKVSDIECGRNAGVKCSVLVRTGYGSEHESQLGQTTGPLAVIDSIADLTNLAIGQAE